MKLATLSFVLLLMGFALLPSEEKSDITELDLMLNDYEKEWKEIDSLTSKLLPKSALDKVDALYSIVRTEQNQAQIIKCLIYRNKLLIQLEDKDPSVAIIRIEKEVNAETLEIPKAFLRSMLAELYFVYAQDNQYRIRNRSFTEKQPSDIATWSIEHLIQKSNDLYLQSVDEVFEDYDQLETYKDILVPAREKLNFQPDVNSFLLHRVVKHFSDSRSLLTEPVHKFVMDDPIYMSSINEFLSLNILAKDTLSYKYQALLANQKLLSYLKGKNRTEELAYTDLARIEFVNQHLITNTHDSLYIDQLESNQQAYIDYEVYAEYSYRIAKYYKNIGERYKQDYNPDLKGYMAKALQIAEDGKDKYPGSFGADNCTGLISQINHKELSVQVEQVIEKGNNFLVHTQFRNIDKLSFHIYKISRVEILDYQRLRQKEKIEFLQKRTPLKVYQKSLIAIDYDTHATEHVLEGLDYGNYLLVATDQNAISDSKIVTHGVIAVSNIGYATQTRNSQLDILVFDRSTGEPITDAEVKVFNQEYKRNKQLHTYETTLYTNSQGKAYYYKEDRSVSLIIKKHKDFLDLRDQHYVYKNHDGSSYSSCKIFTDRNIYRPGQKMYFKGLLLEYNKKRVPSLKISDTVQLILRDPNRQTVQEAVFNTNEYGTFNGSFDLPQSGLNGRYTIEVLSGKDQVGNSSIRVEEYKRPKFEVNIDTLDVEYQLGDTITLSGSAKMYAGAPLESATVRYRITREVRYPYWSWWRPYPSSTDQEIANGETITNADGSFQINVPLRSSDNQTQNNAVYYFKTVVDVVDVTGETQSNESLIKASKTSVFASLNIEKEIDVEDLKDVGIITNNINGKQVNANGLIIVEKLKVPDNFKSKRYWGKTDTKLMPVTDWDQKLPNYDYNVIRGFEDYEIESQIVREGFNTSINRNINLNNKLKSGLYKITTAVDNDEVVQFLAVTDFKENEFANNKLLYKTGLKTAYQPDDKFELKLGSTIKNLPVYYEIERDGKILKSKWLRIKDAKEIEYKLSEKDRGGLFLKLHYAFNNRVFSELIKINVPWTNKDLKLEFTSIRNKVAPGAEEQWQIKITGDKRDKVSAELLATMYDASLDQFAGKHTWSESFYPDFYTKTQWSATGFRASYFQHLKHAKNQYFRVKQPEYPKLNWFGLNRSLNLYGRDMATVRYKRSSRAVPGAVEIDVVMEESEALDEVVVTGYGVSGAKVQYAQAPPPVSEAMDGNDSDDTGQIEEEVIRPEFTPRTNLNETVFFFPDIKTDDDGNVTLNFTMNEALTRWTLLTMAHTTDFSVGFAEQEITTFKNLMVFPNAPRFMRQGDQLQFSAKVQNLTDQIIEANATIELIDATTEKSITSTFDIRHGSQTISLAPQSSELLVWDFGVPEDYTGLVKYRIMASDGTYADGEESYVPTLSNRMLVTETFPLNVKGNQTQTFSLASLKEKSKSSSLTHENFTVEYTSNPAWYAIQAIPYLMEYPHDCSEQLFNRYFANALSSSVANAHPRVKAIFDSWKVVDADALLSNLSKNQELKSAVIAETPWVMNAKSEEQQKQNLAVLFDLNRMSYEQNKAIKKLEDRQLSNGGFAWFPGGRESRYITQYIVEGLGHLDKLGVRSAKESYPNLVRNAIKFIDDKTANQYAELKKRVADGNRKLDEKNIYSLDVHYLYARSYFTDNHAQFNKEFYEYYLSQAVQYWTEFSLYEQAMIALVLHRNGNHGTTNEILKSIKERSILHDELGRYWKTNRGYRWNQHPIELQSLMIELFAELNESQTLIDELRIWLLKNKQTNSWKTTKGTAAAIYALMINKDQSTNTWLLDNEQVSISYGKQQKEISFNNAEPGTLYVKKSFSKSDIDANEISELKVVNPNDVISWGAAYWQYFEQLDKIETFEETPLQIKKKLYIENPNDSGVSLEEVNGKGQIQQGDKVIVRIELRVDRPMEFVHMKDMRASGLEPINVLSQYKWQDGLGYYESTKDVATHFFFSYLGKGTYVFEYPLRATHKGEFSNGITTIQSMYAPEFSSHSEGVMVSIN